VEPLRLCVIGDALLDIDWEGDVHKVCRDAPAPVLEAAAERVRPGGAGLAAVLGVAPTVEVMLVTALSRDADGRRLARGLEAGGVRVVDLGLDAPTPVKLRLRSGSHSLARVDRGCTPVVAPGSWTAAASEAATTADVVLVADYGRGMTAAPPVADGACAAGRPLVWDPHRDGPIPPSAAMLVTPNIGEAHALTGRPAAAAVGVPDLVELAESASHLVGCPVALTAGELGAVLADGRALPAVVPARPVEGDACGAGDRFAVSAAISLGRGEPRRVAVEQAVADAGAFVAGGGVGEAIGSGPGRAADPAGPDATVVSLTERMGRSARAEATARAERVRRCGGVVVAAGGCFAVFHAGHVQLLEHARRLGDHLIVCLNSDASVRRLKGPGRPLNPAADRAAVLGSLACVDGVVVFEEATPVKTPEALRPHLFVKGADYEGEEIEERAVLARWGGRVVLVPLVEGRSTTGIIASAATAGT
jgi:D-beta-D-heptose 7-phosphate kinase/D-beta-D-heptose 1-phosphate adenosyltransferase